MTPSRRLIHLRSKYQIRHAKILQPRLGFDPGHPVPEPGISSVCGSCTNLIDICFNDIVDLSSASLVGRPYAERQARPEILDLISAEQITELFIMYVINRLLI